MAWSGSLVSLCGCGETRTTAIVPCINEEDACGVDVEANCEQSTPALSIRIAVEFDASVSALVVCFVVVCVLLHGSRVNHAKPPPHPWRVSID